MHDERLNDLSSIKRLSIVCDDCGRRTVWREQQIARAQIRHAVHSTVQLGTRLCCRSCKASGGRSSNVSVYVDPLDGLPPVALVEEIRV